MAAPTHGQKKSSKIESKMIKDEKGQLVTMYKRNAGNVLNMNGLTINKFRC